MSALSSRPRIIFLWKGGIIRGSPTLVRETGTANSVEQTKLDSNDYNIAWDRSNIA